MITIDWRYEVTMTTLKRISISREMPKRIRTNASKVYSWMEEYKIENTDP